MIMKANSHSWVTFEITINLSGYGGQLPKVELFLKDKTKQGDYGAQLS